MRVQDSMSQPVETVRPTDTLRRAAELMRDEDCQCIVVVTDESEIVGVLTDRDVCMAALRIDSPLSRLVVEGAMSCRVFPCHSDDSRRERSHDRREVSLSVS